MSTILERLSEIIAEQLRVDVSKVRQDAHLVDDLGADSLDVVDLSIALEEEFGGGEHPFEITEEVAAAMRTVQDILDFLARHDSS